MADLGKIRSIYFIGIGGIGMSALAQFFLAESKEVAGSDTTPSKVTDLLKEKGATIFFNQTAGNMGNNVDLVIYTLAIDQNNSELQEAKKKGIKTLSYPEGLGLIAQDKLTIAISGTHGKTTTTAMIAKIFIDAGLSPTVIAGSLMSEYQSNFVAGNSNLFIVEACEYRRSFLNLNPNILVITNIDNDHLDYYKDLEDIQGAFKEMARKLKPEDYLICNLESPSLEPIVEDKKIECSIIDYYTLEGASPRLQVPGKHNTENAKAALAVASIFEIDSKKATASLEAFSGTWRRLEKKGVSKIGALLFDDYAHHPTEIKATLSSLFEMFPQKKIAVIFQPHLYSRTKSLFTEFSQSFKGAAEVLLPPIYPAREKEDPTINAVMLAEAIEKTGVLAQSFNNFREIADYSNKYFDSHYIVVTMGAGDVYKINEMIV